MTTSLHTSAHYGRVAGWSTPRKVGTAAAAGGVLAALAAARRVQQGWGATEEEIEAVLDGDEILGPADLVATRAVTIKAPPQDVWPWVVQLGHDRAGFYSYDKLQTLAGLPVRNAEEIVPEWQDTAVGDVVRLHPALGLRVASVGRDAALVLHGDGPGGEDGGPVPPYDFTWAFVLRPGPRGTTRLLVRERYAYREPMARPLTEGTQVASFIMTARMLRGIKERAERRPPAELVP